MAASEDGMTPDPRHVRLPFPWLLHWNGSHIGRPRQQSKRAKDYSKVQNSVVAEPLLADIDNDQALELVFSAQGQAPGIYLYDWPGTKPNCLLWPQGRGNPGHTGSYRR